jgi:uncharacterized protein
MSRTQATQGGTVIERQIQDVVEDAEHVRFADGTVFHVRSGFLAEAEGPCACRPDEAVFQIRSYKEAVPQLQLSLTDACNMGCAYCSFRDRVHADGKPVTMPLDTARKGVSYYRDQLSAEDQRYGRVDFGLAGETMLVRHLHEQVHGLVEDGLADSPIATVWAGPNVTNATLSLAPELADALGPPQDISVDGPREIHDRVRFYTNDRGGTYDDVRRVLDQILARHPDMGVSAVLTAYCTDFAMIFRHLYEDIGARNIYMKPVNALHTADYALNADTLPDFQAGYARLVDHILDHPPQGILDRLLALNPEDYFMRFVYRVKDRTVQMYRCGAGKSGAYVDTNGNLYACAHFIGKSGWAIGDVERGVDPHKRQQYLEMTVDAREPCRGCFARYVCGGGCHYQAALVNQDISEPDAVKCELIRFLTRLAIRLVRTLSEQYPEVLAAMPTPFGIDPATANLPADTPYVPQGALVPADPAPALRLGGPGRLCAGLHPATDLRLTLAVRDGALEADLLTSRPQDVTEWRLWLQPYGGDRFTMRDLSTLGPHRSGSLLRIRDGRAQWLDRPAGRFQRVPYPDPDWIEADDVEIREIPGGRRLRVPLEGHRDGTECLGVNVYADLADGGWTALALYEPFVTLPIGVQSGLRLTGPDAEPAPSRPTGLVNDALPSGLLPLGRWAGLQPNVC